MRDVLQVAFAEGMSNIQLKPAPGITPFPAIHRRVEWFGIGTYRTKVAYIHLFMMFWWYAKWYPAGKRTSRCETAIEQEWRQAASDVLLPQSDRILCSSGNTTTGALPHSDLQANVSLEPSVPSILRVTKAESNQKNDSADSRKRYGQRILNETWRCRERSIGSRLHCGLVERWKRRAQPQLCHLTASNWHTRHPS